MQPGSCAHLGDEPAKAARVHTQVLHEVVLATPSFRHLRRQALRDLQLQLRALALVKGLPSVLLHLPHDLLQRHRVPQELPRGVELPVAAVNHFDLAEHVAPAQ